MILTFLKKRREINIMGKQCEINASIRSTALGLALENPAPRRPKYNNVARYIDGSGGHKNLVNKAAVHAMMSRLMNQDEVNLGVDDHQQVKSSPLMMAAGSVYSIHSSFGVSRLIELTVNSHFGSF